MAANKINKKRSRSGQGAELQDKENRKRTERLVIMINKPLDMRMRLYGAEHKVKITEMVEAGLDMYLNQAEGKGGGKK